MKRIWMAVINSALIAGIFFLSNCIVEGNLAGYEELIKAGIGAGLAFLIQLKGVISDYMAKPEKPPQRPPETPKKPRILGLI